ncbi:MAG: YdeI/OmpD-associated family protein [Chitinophagaceae bacterium]|nr:YdeI/OmpD-associated family protein [Chitinophagaceae bacterium]
MSHQSLFEKLELKDERNLLIQGLPSSIEKQFIKLSYSKNVTPLLKLKKIDFALVFAINVNQLNGILREVIPALHKEGKLWVAYPKTTSKISSDLNRDCSWSVLTQNQYETIVQVALDHVWSALQFKKTDQISAAAALADEAPVELVEEEFDKQISVLPSGLEKIFTRHKKARDFFQNLSVTNQNEFVTWIEGAKKEDTRKRRLEATVEKLLAGKKSPSEK